MLCNIDKINITVTMKKAGAPASASSYMNIQAVYTCRQIIALSQTLKALATRNDFVNDIVDDARADAIFATLKTIVDDIVTCGRAFTSHVLGPGTIFHSPAICIS